ncbi:MAG: hypothetical protein QNI84_15200 [Henriciella sp.]|nr:hypothetical protein [Henriciella sp.]
MRDLRQPNIEFQIRVLANAIDIISARLTGPEADNPSVFIQREAVLAIDECRSAITVLQELVERDRAAIANSDIYRKSA